MMPICSHKRWAPTIIFVLLLLLQQQSDASSRISSIKSLVGKPSLTSSFVPRGGSTAVLQDDEDEDNTTNDNDIRNHPEFQALQKYRMQQQVLLQLRATFLSEALARRGLPLPTMMDVATPDGQQPPQPVDWDCAMATEESPKPCLYSFDAEPNTKVIAPIDTTQWISLGALNRLRRTDPSKVEPMWHDKYAILESWFQDSPYSLLQHVGMSGFLLHALLQGKRLNMVLAAVLIVTSIICMPILEYIVNRFLVSGFLWIRWHQWSRFVHAAFPVKLLLGQMAGQFAAGLFDKLLGIVKEQLVEWECQILEQNVPLTVGVPTMSSSSEEEEELENEDGDDDFHWGAEDEDDLETEEETDDDSSDDDEE